MNYMEPANSMRDNMALIKGSNDRNFIKPGGGGKKQFVTN